MEGIKKLENWMTFPEAARLLGVTNQGFHKMIEVQHMFPLDALRKIGDKPTYIVQTVAVLELKETREFVKKSLTNLQSIVDDLTQGNV